MRSRSCSLTGLALFALLGGAASARAQEPDQRDIPPFVMLVADTSGSMEYLPNCVCPPAPASCDACLPQCALPNVSGEPPANKKNKWSVLLETLTGKFVDYQCVPMARTQDNKASYDLNYPLPYNRPWTCPVDEPVCDYPKALQSPLQVSNGLLDNYLSRIRFGVATFDGMRTFSGRGDLVKEVEFNLSLSNGDTGAYSYGGAKSFRYPSCDDNYLMDSGIRSASAPEGGLISLNSCATPPCDMTEINSTIQSALLRARTFGGTPIAAALDDLYYHFKTDFNDQFASCRDRYAILITDGEPDDDFRDFPNPGCDCANGIGLPCGGSPDNHCPYPLAADAARSLFKGKNTTDGPQLSKLFVVGMSIDDAKSRARLNLVASNGGSTDDDKDGNEAYFANDPATLVATLDTMLGGLTKPISRSVPAFATGLSGVQYQVSTGFRVTNSSVPTGFSPPWQGILERRRFLCSDKGQLDSPDLAPADKFDELLNKQASRTLWTAVPLSATSAKLEGAMPRGSADKVCGLNGCSQKMLSDVDASLFAVNATQKTTLVDWMYGNTGSLRETHKLGDIYHSSPTVVGPPVEDPGDQSYTLFKESALIRERPVVVYVNSNDGILHAFSLEDYPVTGGAAPTYHAGLTLKAGQELWGFVPPMLLNDLNNQLSAHKLNLDATPVVKDVFFKKTGTPAVDDYKTVLITGMRSGGNGYMALDVTDPTIPKFLWQFTDSDMGATYGQPEIVQAVYGWPAGQPASTRAMAILPGGKGTLGAGPGCIPLLLQTLVTKLLGSSQRYETAANPDETSSNTLKHRDYVQCWNQVGRALYFVDVETGQLIKKVFDNDLFTSNGTIFSSPVIGSPTAYQDSVGTVATEGFVMDADGVLWRIDLSDPDPHPNEGLAGWTVRPFHDLFWDKGKADGETSYEKPILSLDSKHRLVVIAGTGDTDNFEKPNVMNRVVSLTEVTKTTPPTTASDYGAAINWELRADGPDDGSKGFVKSELVTGSMALYQGQLYFPSFISVQNSSDQCARGLGRLWSFDFVARDTTANSTSSGTVISPATYPPKRLDVVSSADAASNTDITLFNIKKAQAEQNLLVQGLGSTQRPSCSQAEESLMNYFSPPIKGITQTTTTPSIWLVAQASGNGRGRIRAGSQLGTLQVQVNRPTSFSVVSSWAGSIE